MKINRNYRDLESFEDEEGFVIFDNGAFNRHRTSSSLIERLKEAIRIRDPRDRRITMEALAKNIEQEVEYLQAFTKIIVNKDNWLTTPGICSELEDYRRKLNGYNWVLGPIRPYLAEFDTSLSEIYLACSENAMPRAEKIVRRRPIFPVYKKWLEKHARSEENRLNPNGRFNGETEKKVDERMNDNEVMALALTCSIEQPAILLTSDSRHVGRTMNYIYGPRDPLKIKRFMPKISENRMRVYVYFERGLTLWVDSYDKKKEPAPQFSLD